MAAAKKKHLSAVRAGHAGVAAAKKLAAQRAKVRALQLAVKSERNVTKKVALAVQLRAELLKLQIMLWKAAGRKAKGVAVASKPPTHQHAVMENYVDYLLYIHGMAPKRHKSPPFNVSPAEARIGLTPAIRQAQLERTFLALCKRDQSLGRLSPKMAQLCQKLRPVAVPAKDAAKVDAFVASTTATVTTPPAPSAEAGTVIDSTIPADPTKLTDAVVDALVIDSEAAEKGLESGAISAKEATEVAAAGDAPAEEVVETEVAEGEAQQAAAVGFSLGGMDVKTLGLLAAAAAGVYFFVLKK